MVTEDFDHLFFEDGIVQIDLTAPAPSILFSTILYHGELLQSSWDVTKAFASSPVSSSTSACFLLSTVQLRHPNAAIGHLQSRP